ncbi:hypothetical protein Tco_0417570 [Tanacetum coccineum]
MVALQLSVLRLDDSLLWQSLTLEIHHGGWFTPTPSRSYIGGHVSSVNVVDIDEFCLHDIKDMIVKLGYGVEDLMYCHFLIPNLGLDYGLHSLNVDADVLEMSKYVKNYKIILVYVEHENGNVDTSMFDCSPDVNRNVKKEWENVSSKSSSIGEAIKKLSKEQPASSVARPIVLESDVDPFDGLDEILGVTPSIQLGQRKGPMVLGHSTITQIIENNSKRGVLRKIYSFE